MNQPISLLDLKRHHEPIRDELLDALTEVVDSSQFIQGPKVAELEQLIADYSGCKYGIGVSSGTDALLVSLMSLGIQAGDEVITTPFTFFATAGSISRLGAVPVFVDIDPETYNIDPNLIEEKITKKTKAIMPVHLYGQMADMTAIMELADKHNLFVVEDAAQAIGSATLFKGEERKAGSIGDLGCFSFFPSKNLGCFGDGGMIVTNDADLAEKCRVLRVHGSKPKYYHHVVGGNFRLDPIQAAVLLVKFPHLEKQHERRIENASYYNAKLSNDIAKPVVSEGNRMIYNQYTIRSSRIEDVKVALKNAGIGHVVYYPVPLHLQECFSDLGYKEGDCPESEKAASEVVSIPVYPELSDQEREQVTAVINQSLQ